MGTNLVMERVFFLAKNFRECEMEIEDLAIADGTVTSVHSEQGRLRVAFKDWQEKSWIIEFIGVAASENYGVEGVDLSHISEGDDGELRKRASSVIGESVDETNCYIFVSGWGEQPLLRLLAEACNVSKEKEENSV